MYSLTFCLYTIRFFWFWWLWPLASLPCQLNNTIMAFMVPIHRGTHTASLLPTELPFLLTLLDVIGSISTLSLIIFTIIMPFPISVPNPLLLLLLLLLPLLEDVELSKHKTFVTVKRFENFFRNNLTNDLVLIGLIHF